MRGFYFLGFDPTITSPIKHLLFLMNADYLNKEKNWCDAKDPRFKNKLDYLVDGIEC